MNVILINHTRTILKPLEELTPVLKLEITQHSGGPLTDIINPKKPYVIMINWVDGLADQTISMIKKLGEAKTRHFILILTTKDSIAELSGAFAAGADDYLAMPFSKDELKFKLTAIRKIINLKTNFIKTKKKLIKASREDPVTSVLNRRALLDEILNEMGRASRKGEFTCAIMINLHNSDDIMRRIDLRIFEIFLSEFAARLKKSIRPYDTLGRFEGYRFLMFLPNTRDLDAHKVALRIIKNIQDRSFRYKDNLIEPCVSIGISEMDPEDIEKRGDIHTVQLNDLILESFIRRSEFATTTACEKGNNQIEIYTF